MAPPSRQARGRDRLAFGFVAARESDWLRAFLFQGEPREQSKHWSRNEERKKKKISKVANNTQRRQSVNIIREDGGNKN